jgi:hypothetical protein
MRSIVYRDPKALTRPLRRDVHILIGLQARMPDAVPDELRHEHPRIAEKLGRDREGSERPSHLSQGSRGGTNTQIQSRSRLCLWGNAVRVHHHGLPGR